MWIMKFYWLDLDPMALLLKFDLDIVKMYMCTKDEAPTFNSSKVIVWTDTQTDTDRQTDRLDWSYYLSSYADGKYLKF